MRYISLLGLLLLATSVCAQTTRDGITIPANGTHPFTYWTSARKTTASSWVTTTSYAALTTATRTLDARDVAFACYVMGNSTACTNLVTYVTGLTTGSCTGAGSDTLRVSGIDIGLPYDWAYSSFTAGQLSTLNTTWIPCQNSQDNNSSDWGLYGATGTKAMPTSNYFAGDWLNEIFFGIGMFYDNSNAPTQMLDIGIGNKGGAVNGSRANAFINWAALTGLGSEPDLTGSDIEALGYADPCIEGGQYGRYCFYPAAFYIPTMRLLGRDLSAETTAYKAGVFTNIYNTIWDTTGFACHAYFSFSDDENWVNACASSNISHNGYATGSTYATGGGGAMMSSEYFGDFMQMMVNEQSTTNVGKYARQWLNTVQPSVSPIFASLDANPAPLAFSNLPLDYCASSGLCWSGNSTWYTTGGLQTQFFGNLPAMGTGHNHQDAGNFQVWRKGVPIIRETVDYNNTIAGLGDVGTVAISSTFGHNGLLINGHGLYLLDNICCLAYGYGTVQRRDSQTNYFYEESDLTGAYSNSGGHGNTSVVQHVREFINYRALPGIVTLDRVKTTGSTVPVTYLGHCETNPTVNTAGTFNFVDCIDSGQQARWTFLDPAKPTITVVHESDNSATCVNCQYRIEAANSNPGNVTSYFVVFVQLGDSAGFTGLSPSFTDSNSGNPLAGTFTVSLDANDSVVFNKGNSSSGGTVTANSVASTLSTTVESMQVTDTGPVWGGNAPAQTSVPGRQPRL